MSSSERHSITRKPVNQAALVALPGGWLTEDRMAFRDAGELAVYRGLKRAQASRPVWDTLTIVPNPLARVAGRTLEPDFFVAYRGRCGMIAVDGDSHHGRWQSDKSKDDLYENSGIRYVNRIAVEDTNDAHLVDKFVERFLFQLLK
jgi:hypothetical protein